MVNSEKIALVVAIHEDGSCSGYGYAQTGKSDTFVAVRNCLYNSGFPSGCKGALEESKECWTLSVKGTSCRVRLNLLL